MSQKPDVLQWLAENPSIVDGRNNKPLFEEFPSVKPNTLKCWKTIARKNRNSVLGTSELEDFIRDNMEFIQPRVERPLKWQIEASAVILKNAIIKLLIPREHGKSWLLCWIMEMYLNKGKSVLLLGWTNRRKDLAVWVYNYCYIKGLIDISKSEFNFTLKNGARFYCDLVSSKDALGFHEIDLLVMDDVIDETFIIEPHKEEKLERHYKSTISNINSKKTILSGTRKGMGDFFDYWDDTYKDSDYNYAEFIRTPYLEDGGLLAPEIWTHERLELKRAEIGEYQWGAEYMQDPHPILAGIFSKPEFGIHAGKSAYEYAAIAVDSARTTNKKSDFTAIVTILKVRNKLEYFVLRAFVGKIEFEEILREIESAYEFVLRNFIDISVIVPIETNGGGEYIISSAKSRGYKFAMHIVPVHSSKNKLIRIESALEIPLREKAIIFSEGLRNSELITEVNTFPNCRKLDAVDDLAIGIKELEKKHIVISFSFAKANL